MERRGMNDVKVDEISAGGVVVRVRDGMREGLLIRIRRDVYELPKGHVEAGETIEQAAIREIHEETGIRGELRIDRELGSLAYSIARNGMKRSKRVHYFGLHADGDVSFDSLPKGSRELKWVNETELVEVPLVKETLRTIVSAGLGVA